VREEFRETQRPGKALHRHFIESMSTEKSFRHSVSWLFLGNTGTQLLTFAFGVVLARLLAPEVFGLLVTIQIFTGLAGFVSGGGMGQALVRAKDVTQRDFNVVFTLQLLIGCCIYAVFFFSAPLFARWYDFPLYTDLLRVSALTFITRPLVNLPNSILHRNMRFKAQTTVRIITLLVSSMTSIGLAIIGWGVWSLVLGGLSGSIVSALLFSLFARWRPGLDFGFRHGLDLARYGFLVSANDIVIYIRQQTTNFILGRTLGMTSVGLFNKSDSLMRMPNSFITGSVYQALFRALAKDQDEPAKGRSMFLSAIRLVCVYTLPFYIMLFWLAHPLIEGVYGLRWVDAAAPLAMLSLCGPFLIIENLSGAVLAAHNWLQRELFVQCAVLALTAIATISGLSGGLEWMSAMLVLVSIYCAMHMYLLASRCIGTGWRDLARAITPAAMLNAPLFFAMWAITALLAPYASTTHPLLIVLIAGSAGALLYTSAFLVLPIKSLASERDRWKALLRAALPGARPEA
jgi:O-antigen/teichoic acid export membrane protein